MTILKPIYKMTITAKGRLILKTESATSKFILLNPGKRGLLIFKMTNKVIYEMSMSTNKVYTNRMMN